MSFMAIRLLQSFSSFSLEMDAFPPEARPPVEWAEKGRGRKAKERFRPQIVLTMSSKVCWFSFWGPRKADWVGGHVREECG